MERAPAPVARLAHPTAAPLHSRALVTGTPARVTALLRIAGIGGREPVNESFATVYSSPGRDVAPDGRHFAGRLRRVQAVTCIGAAPGRLSHHPGPHVLSGRE